MAFELMPLPYDKEALAPAISAETLGFHHGKHHKAYIDKTNAAIEGTDLAGESLEAVIAKARAGDKKLFNNAAQSWNHGFYWNSLAPSSGTPSDELQSMLVVGLALIVGSDFKVGTRPHLVERLVERHPATRERALELLIRQRGFQRGAHERVAGVLRAREGARVTAQIRQISGDLIPERHARASAGIARS